MRRKIEYEIEYTRAADKFLNTHEDVRTRYEEAIKKLMAGDREGVDVREIAGKRTKYYRIRIGGYRVVYTTLRDGIIVVITVLAGSRGDIYKKMKGLN